MEADLQPDDPEDRCPTCGERIPDGQGIPCTEYYGTEENEGNFTTWYCSQQCIADRS